MKNLAIETVTTEAEIPLVHLRGEIDLHTCPELRESLHGLLDAGQKYVILEMSEVPYLDSAALGVLVEAQRRAKEKGGEVFLSEVTPFVLRAFEITRLIRIFQVFGTVAEAEQAVKSAETG